MKGFVRAAASAVFLLVIGFISLWLVVQFVQHLAAL